MNEIASVAFFFLIYLCFLFYAFKKVSLGTSNDWVKKTGNILYIFIIALIATIPSFLVVSGIISAIIGSYS